MKKPFLTLCVIVFGSLVNVNAQNLLAIPDTLSGTTFNLNLLDTNKVFFTGFTTNTFGVNTNYLGPTLFLNKGDSIHLNVHNQLMDTTTIHWHGLHVSAKNDGGPHIVIPPDSIWKPSFRVRDHASTYWYHPHMHHMTNLHAALGAAGMIIVRDTIEAALTLPRKYGVDDFPLVLQSKSFDANKQIVVHDAADSIFMVNGTIDAYLPTPAQVVRFRLLNASSERILYIGLQGNLPFYQIATDGGLLNAPVQLTRFMLSPGERAEILVDFSGMTGQNINLMSFASELPNGIYGALQPGMGPGQTIPGYTLNPLNGADYPLMSFSIVTPTANPVTSIPTTLTTNTPWPIASADDFKTLIFTPVNQGPTAIQGPFYINNTLFDMGTINYRIPLDNIEIWTLTNQSPIAHPFHIHDVQFYITEIAGAAPPPHLAGRKDVVLVRPGQTVKFITKFETFCDPMGMYMYHCHMLTHEDEGMMGQFVVECPTNVSAEEIIAGDNELILFPNPTVDKVTIKMNRDVVISSIAVYDFLGKRIIIKNNINQIETIVDLQQHPTGIYLFEININDKVLRKKISLIK
ncbi:MAG: multicopper oxidase domain-containing protein [Cryomorphaceae bacterium]|nr:multicopper oxidase domain-containing protein [Cryomorphaceae bacterium]